MMTIVTRVELAPDIIEEWDATMVARMEAAESADGWVAGQILASVDAPAVRHIIGVWETVDHWDAWHSDARFRETRERLDELGADPGETRWYHTVYEARKASR